MKLRDTFLGTFMGTGDDALIQVKDEPKKDELTLEDLERAVQHQKKYANMDPRAEQEFHRQMSEMIAEQQRRTAQMHQQAFQQQQKQGQQQSPFYPLTPPGAPSFGQPPPPPQGLNQASQKAWDTMFGRQTVEEVVTISKQELEERLRESWHDGFEEGYDDAETYYMEKEQYGWQTFDDLEKVAGTNPVLSGAMGQYNGAVLFGTRAAVSGGESLEGNEEQVSIRRIDPSHNPGTFDLETLDKAVDAAKKENPKWDPRWVKGIAHHYTADQLKANEEHTKALHGVLAGSELPSGRWTDGLERELSSLDSHGEGHSEESEGELVREGVYEEAQEVAQARRDLKGRETDE